MSSGRASVTILLARSKNPRDKAVHHIALSSIAFVRVPSPTNPYHLLPIVRVPFEQSKLRGVMRGQGQIAQHGSQFRGSEWRDEIVQRPDWNFDCHPEIRKSLAASPV